MNDWIWTITKYRYIENNCISECDGKRYDGPLDLNGNERSAKRWRMRTWRTVTLLQSRDAIHQVLQSITACYTLNILSSTSLKFTKLYAGVFSSIKAGHQHTLSIIHPKSKKHPRRRSMPPPTAWRPPIGNPGSATVFYWIDDEHQRFWNCIPQFSALVKLNMWTIYHVFYSMDYMWSLLLDYWWTPKFTELYMRVLWSKKQIKKKKKTKRKKKQKTKKKDNNTAFNNFLLD